MIIKSTLKTEVPQRSTSRIEQAKLNPERISENTGGEDAIQEKVQNAHQYDRSPWGKQSIKEQRARDRVRSIGSPI